MVQENKRQPFSALFSDIPSPTTVHLTTPASTLGKSKESRENGFAAGDHQTLPAWETRRNKVLSQQQSQLSSNSSNNSSTETVREVLTCKKSKEEVEKLCMSQKFAYYTFWSIYSHVLRASYRTSKVGARTSFPRARLKKSYTSRPKTFSTYWVPPWPSISRSCHP